MKSTSSSPTGCRRETANKKQNAKGNAALVESFKAYMLSQSDDVTPMRLEKIEHLTDDQINDLHRMYQEEWWTKGRELEEAAACWNTAT